MDNFYAKLNGEVAAGNVSKVIRDDLVLFRYTQQCHKKKNWNDVTLRCRGLIVDWTTQTVVGRPFDKFFNLNEPGFPQNSTKAVRKATRNQRYWASEMVDGTMITVFFAEGRWQCATHRSLSGPHVDAANELLEKKNYCLTKGYTYVCEYTAPWDRKVIDYGGEEDFCLLSIHHNSWIPSLCTTIEMEIIAQKMGGIRIAKDVALFEDVTKLRTAPKSEGYVILFESGHRVKVKTEWYMNARALLGQLSDKMIMQYAQWDNYDKEVLVDLGEERQETVERLIQIVRDLKEEVLREVNSCWAIITLLVTGSTESRWLPDKTLYKDLALIIKKYQKWMQSCLFSLMKGKYDLLEALVWKEADRRFRNDI